MALITYNSTTDYSFSVDGGLETLVNEQMVRILPTFRSKRKKRSTPWRQSTISERMLLKIAVPFNFQSKFPDFGLNGKHPLPPYHCMFQFSFLSLNAVIDQRNHGLVRYQLSKVSLPAQLTELQQNRKMKL